MKAPACPLERAQLEVSNATTGAFSASAFLRRKQDIEAMLEYEIIRGFCISEPAYGNTLMFDCPRSYPPVGLNESIFNAFPIDDIISMMRESIDPQQTIIDAAETYALNGLSRLARLIADKQITVELVCSEFQDIMPYVKSLKPRTMSWSNVCDYISYREFHRMARDCSQRDTVHFGYSMNWSHDVFGTSIIDFPGPEHADYRKHIIATSNQMATQKYASKGWDNYLRCPPPRPVHVTASQYFLDRLHFETWAVLFFALASVDGPCDVKKLEYGIYTSPFSTHGPSTLGFTWTYNDPTSDPRIIF